MTSPIFAALSERQLTTYIENTSKIHSDVYPDVPHSDLHSDILHSDPDLDLNSNLKLPRRVRRAWRGAMPRQRSSWLTASCQTELPKKN